MAFDDLEKIKSQLEDVRKHIIDLQNVQSLLFRLPGELRNKIFLLAMHAELQDRKESSRYTMMFRKPNFFATSRQIRAECTSVWESDILIWEEFDSSRQWRRVKPEEVKAICRQRSTTGKPTLITQLAHCDVSRTRRNVEGSCSICPRKGLVRLQSEIALQLRWWVW